MRVPECIEKGFVNVVRVGDLQRVNGELLNYVNTDEVQSVDFWEGYNSSPITYVKKLSIVLPDGTNLFLSDSQYVFGTKYEDYFGDGEEVLVRYVCYKEE